uniref:uncharacterized protein LOC120329385 n=1 Tax=Styela clava TaxID=7725 RepID=UPI00193997AE|nr:uncharacterized protein LOC120329385 [Styela clava]
MAVAVAEAVSCILQCIGVVCLCIAGIVEWAKKAFAVVTKIVTCGQGWQGFFMNCLTFFNSEEDPDFKDFDLPEAENRTVTDMPSLVLFITVLLGMMAGMNRAIAYGKPEVYFQGIDSWGNICGYENLPITGSVFSGRDMTKFDKLLIFDFLSRSSVLTSGDAVAMSEIPFTTSICVEHCPLITRTFDCWEYLGIKSIYPNVINDLLCRSAERELNTVRMRTLSFSERNSRCVPDVVSESISVEKQNKMLSLYSTHWVHNVIADCGTCAAELTWMTLIAAGCTMIFICVIQSASDTICWFSFSSFTFVGLISSICMWYMYSGISANDSATVLYSAGESDIMNSDFAHGNLTGNQWKPHHLQSPKQTISRNSVPQAGYSIVFRDASIYVTFFTLFLTFICCLVGKRNMDAAAALFSIAIRAMIKVRWIYILPVVTLCSVSFAAGLFLYTVNLLTAVFKDDISIVEDTIYKFPRAVIEEDLVYTNWVLLFEFLAFAWLFNFIMACQTLIACSAISSWYFIKDKEDLDRPLRIGSSRLLRCHLGSAAAGGLLVGFLGWMRAPFSFLQSRLNRALLSGGDEPQPIDDSQPYSDYYGKPYSVQYDYEKGKDQTSKKSISGDNVPAASKGPEEEPYYSDRGEAEVNSKYSKNSANTKYSKHSSASQTQPKPPQSLEIPVKYIRFVAQLFSPCFYVLNNLLIYISDINFSIVALKGSSFIQAGFDVRDMLVKDPKLKGLGAISSFSLFLGKLSVVIVVLPFGFLFLRNKEGVFIYGYPLAMSAAISFVVAHIFLSLFNAAVGTIFACLMEDRALNDGSVENPYFGDEKLIMKFHEILHVGDSDDDTPDFHYAYEFPRPANRKKAARDAHRSGSELGSSKAYSNEAVDSQPKPKKKTAKKKKGNKKADIDNMPPDHSSMFLLMPKKNQPGDMTEKLSSSGHTTSYEEVEEKKVRKAKKEKRHTTQTKLQHEKRQTKDENSVYSDSYSTRSHRHRHSKRHHYADDHRHRESRSYSGSGGSGGLLGNLFGAVANRRNQDNEDSDGGFGGFDDFGGDDDDDDDDGGGDDDDGGDDMGGEENEKDKAEKTKEKKDKDKTKTKDKNKQKTDKKKNKKDKPKKDKPEKKQKTDKSGKKTKGGKSDKIKDKPSKKAKPTKKDKGKTPKAKPKKAPKSAKPKGKAGKMKKPKLGKSKKPKLGKGKKPKLGKMKKPKMKKPKLGKMKKPKMKKPKLGKMKKPKMGKMKGFKKPKMGKMKGFKKPKMGKMKGFKKPKMGKMKGFKKPKMGKMKGFKKPKMGKMRGMKKPKMGKMKGFKKPKMRKMKGPKMKGGGKMRGGMKGGGRKMGGGMRGGGGGKMGGGGGMGKMKGGKMGKMAKVGKGLGMAGAVIGGAEGAANIGNAMLRITGKKEAFNDKVNDVTFGTRKRAKAATAMQTIMGGGGGLRQAMQDVDAQFDEMEAEQKRERKRQRKQEKREKANMQNLLQQRLMARKRQRP